MKRLIVASGCIVALAAAFSTASGELAAKETARVAVETGGCLYCADAPELGCVGDEHDAWEGGGGVELLGTGRWARAGGPHSTQSNCKPGTCDTKHGPCQEVSSANDDKARAAIDGGDAGAVSRLLRESSGRVVVNAERAAVQVLGCDGEMLSHLPVSQALLAVLLDDREISAALNIGAIGVEN